MARWLEKVFDWKNGEREAGALFLWPFWAGASAGAFGGYAGGEVA